MVLQQTIRISERRLIMNRLNGVVGGILAAGFIGFLTLGPAAAGELILSQQIVDALTAAPKAASFAAKLGQTRSMTYDGGEYKLASAPSMPHIDLEVYFDFDSAEITPKAVGQLRELGKALTNAKLQGASIAINGHTDAVGGDAFNRRLSERRAVMIKQYLVENFSLPDSALITAGYGKTRLKNPTDPLAAENRRVEVVNLAPQAQAQR
jgi:outer membrane protein OmpA-like peptidoglycan-associated protein